MRVLRDGHSYELDYLQDPTIKASLDFYSDGEINGGASEDGPSTQEVIRACIDRVRFLHAQVPCEENVKILAHLRGTLLQFEIIAYRRRLEKLVALEEIPVDLDGHFKLNRL